MVPITRARYSCNFITVAKNVGAPVHRILDKAGLTESIFEHPHVITTAWQLGQVAPLAEMEEALDGTHLGLKDFGMKLKAAEKFFIELFRPEKEEG